MPHRPLAPPGPLLAAFAFSLAASGPRPALAEPQRPAAACVRAHPRAQELRRDLRLLEARTQLTICAANACPDAIRRDCSRWIEEVEALLPTVTVSIRDAAGAPVPDARVSIDGRPAASFDEPFPLDPGSHLVEARAGGERRQARFALRTGERGRVVRLTFPPPERQAGALAGRAAGASAEAKSGSTTEAPRRAPASAAAAPPTAAAEAPPPRGRARAYAFLGMAAAGAAGFVLLGRAGQQREDELRERCAPSCSNGEARGVTWRYRLADASLLLGGASLGVATYLLLSSPARGGVQVGLGSISWSRAF